MTQGKQEDRFLCFCQVEVPRACLGRSDLQQFDLDALVCACRFVGCSALEKPYVAKMIVFNL